MLGRGAGAGLDQAPAVEAPEVITSGASVLGGGVWKVISVALPQLYVLTVSIVAARYLGPAAFGRQSFIAFVELSLISLLAAGLPVALMRQVGEAIGSGRRGAVRSLFRWALSLELAGALVGGLSLAAAGLLGAEPHAAWVLAGVVCALGILHTVPSALLIGLQRWRQATVAGIATGGVSTVATIVVLALGGGITGMFAVEAAASAAILAWTVALARRALDDVAPQPAPAPDLRRRMTRTAGLASITVVLDLIVWKRSEFVFLEGFSTDEQIAFYSIAFAVVTAVVRLPGTVAGVLAPAFANLMGAGETERIRLGFARSMRLLVLVALPLVAAALALGPAAVETVWGDGFADAGAPLLIMAAASILGPISDLGYALFLGIGRLRVPLATDGFAALVNVGLALLLIPGHGAVGAALANSGAQLAAAVPIVVFARRTLRGIPWAPARLLPVLAVSAAAGTAARTCVHLIGGDAGLVAGSAAGVLVFVGLALSVGVLPREDAAWLERAVGDRLRGVVGEVCRRISR
jgi:O-antigen/teichoic acid export membrane protein